MKKAILILLLALATLSSFGQKIRFTDSTNVWTWYQFGCGGDDHVWKYVSRYGGDSTVNSTTYKKLYNYNIGLYPTLVREDTITKKVIFLHTDSTEKILYDYNLQMGDTFASIRTAHIVDSVDSVEINGIPYKYWHLHDTALSGLSPFADYFFIEGVGCTNEPLYPINPYFFEDCFVLTCFTNKGTLPLLTHKVPPHFDNDTSCTLTFGLDINNPARNKKVNLYPNPIDNSCKIVFLYNLSGNILLLNSIGQIIVNLPFTNENELLIGDKITVSGLYYYRVTDEQNGKVFSGKFVRQ
jgi:hypothetical protein